MTDEEIKQYINVQIKEALKCQVPVPRGLPPDSDLLRQLDKLELWRKAMIASFLRLPPELGWKAIFVESYRLLRRKEREDTSRGVSAGIAELERLLEQDEHLEV